VHTAWTHEYFEALRPRAIGVYSNFLEAEGRAVRALSRDGVERFHKP